MNFFNTYISQESKQLVSEVLNSTFVSEGRYVEEFEKSIIKKLKLKEIAAVNSGTSALHLALVAAGIKSGDEVILPAQTFIATGLAILYLGAVPVFADIQLETGNLCPKSVREKITNRTKAIIVVHWAGYPCDINTFLKIKEEFNLQIIEDAAHAFGATYQNKYIGSFSDFTCFSFQAIKHITTGDGGAICAKKKKDIERVKKLRWFGIDRINDTVGFLGERDYNLNEIGFKYHMNNISAAIGIGNLNKLEKILKRHSEIRKIYQESLNSISGIQLTEFKSDRTSSNWFLQILVEDRNKFVKLLKAANIPASIVHRRIDKNNIFNNKNDLPNQNIFEEKKIALPIHCDLTNGDIYNIISTIKKGW